VCCQFSCQHTSISSHRNFQPSFMLSILLLFPCLPQVRYSDKILLGCHVPSLPGKSMCFLSPNLCFSLVLPVF
jgi:hypothetical protein